MAVTSYSATRLDRLIIVTVTSDLSDTIYYHWYADGSWLGVTLDARFTVALEADEQVEIVAHDTNDAAYDPVANAPAGWPARRTLFWTASASADISSYKIERRKDAGDWTEIGSVSDDGSWDYRFLTARLVDLSSYEWRVTPVDLAGNEGTAKALDAMKIVRRPDSPDFAIAYDSGTQKVTFSEAA